MRRACFACTCASKDGRSGGGQADWLVNVVQLSASLTPCPCVLSAARRPLDVADPSARARAGVDTTSDGDNADETARIGADKGAATGTGEGADERASTGVDEGAGANRGANRAVDACTGAGGRQNCRGRKAGGSCTGEYSSLTSSSSSPLAPVAAAVVVGVAPSLDEGTNAHAGPAAEGGQSE